MNRPAPAPVIVHEPGDRRKISLDKGYLNLSLGQPDDWDKIWPAGVFEGEERVAVITLMRVEPERRGKGIGTALVRSATEEAWHSGAEAVYLHAVDPRDPTPFYEKLGFEIVAYDDDGPFLVLDRPKADAAQQAISGRCAG